MKGNNIFLPSTESYPSIDHRIRLHSSTLAPALLCPFPLFHAGLPLLSVQNNQANKGKNKENSSRLRSLLVSESPFSPIGGVYPEVCRTITVHAASELSGMKERAPGGCIDPGRMSGRLLCLKDNEIGYVRGRRTDTRPGVNMVSSNRPFSTQLYPDTLLIGR